MKENLIHIFRFAYLIWTLFYIIDVFSSIGNNQSIQIVSILNMIFLSYGLYYMFKYYSK